MGALDRLRGANGDGGFIDRARSDTRLLIAIVAGVLLVLAWIGWAVYVTSSNGATAGLGVVIAWPAMLAALVLISLPFIGGYLLIRRLSEDSGSAGTAEVKDEDQAEEEEAEEDEDSDEPEDSAEEEDEDGEDEEDEEEGEDVDSEEEGEDEDSEEEGEDEGTEEEESEEEGKDEKD